MTPSTLYNTGKRIPYSNSGSAIAEGDIVSRVVGSTGVIGIAVSDIAATTGTGELETEGVWTCPKASGEAFTDGQQLYFDGTQLTGTSSTTFTRAGRSVGAHASAATTCKCKINVA